MAIEFDQPIFVISVAAELADMHPQTLRQYDRLGLVVPRRTRGRGRRYSRRDVVRLLQVQRLAQVEGINLAGIKRILDLEAHVSVLEERLGDLLMRVQEEGRVFAAGPDAGDVVVVQRGQRVRSAAMRVDLEHRAAGGGAVVLWRPAPRREG
jgi:MerR family transcriptional regulator/heat shock protein HspR